MHGREMKTAVSAARLCLARKTDGLVVRNGTPHKETSTLFDEDGRQIRGRDNRQAERHIGSWISKDFPGEVAPSLPWTVWSLPLCLSVTTLDLAISPARVFLPSRDKAFHASVCGTGASNDCGIDS